MISNIKHIIKRWYDQKSSKSSNDYCVILRRRNFECRKSDATSRLAIKPKEGFYNERTIFWYSWKIGSWACHYITKLKNKLNTATWGKRLPKKLCPICIIIHREHMTILTLNILRELRMTWRQLGLYSLEIQREYKNYCENKPINYYIPISQSK